MKLNRRELLESRRRYVGRYLRGQVSLAVLAEDAPFLASELERHGLQPEGR